MSDNVCTGRWIARGLMEAGGNDGQVRAKGKPRYTPEQLKALDEARFSQKTDAINRRINAVYFWGLGMKQRRRTPIPGKADPARQEEFKKNPWNHCWTRPDPASVRSTSSTRLTLSLAPS